MKKISKILWGAVLIAISVIFSLNAFVYGTGENLIDIDGGVGEINIEFSEYGNE